MFGRDFYDDTPDETALTPTERTALRKASDLLDAAQAEEVREEGAPDKNIAGAIDIIDGLAGDEPGS